jgi:hypothetical protein
VRGQGETGETSGDKNETRRYKKDGRWDVGAGWGRGVAGGKGEGG